MVCINASAKFRSQDQNAAVSSQKTIEPSKPIQAQTEKIQIMTGQQAATAKSCDDRDKAREDKRRGKQIATCSTEPRGGPKLYNPFEALGSLEEKG